MWELEEELLLELESQSGQELRGCDQPTAKLKCEQCDPLLLKVIGCGVACYPSCTQPKLVGIECCVTHRATAKPKGACVGSSIPNSVR